MKTLILSFYYKPDICAGAFRTEALIKSLIRLRPNEKVDIFTTQPHRYNIGKKLPRVEYLTENIKVYRFKVPFGSNSLGASIFNFFVFSLQSSFYLCRNVLLTGRYNRVFATSSRFFTSLLGIVYSSLLGSKCLLDVRDSFSDTLRTVYSKKLPSFIFDVLYSFEKHTYASSHWVNFVSPSFLDYYGFSKSGKVSCFTNGIDDIFIESDFNKIKRSENDVKYITYIGNIGVGQGIPQFLERVLSYLPECYKIRVIGGGGDAKTVASLTNKYRNLEFISAVPRSLLIDYYAESEILLLVLGQGDAFKKVLPSKIFEYAATGKPVISGVSGFAKEFVKDNVDGVEIFDPLNADSFIKAINDTVIENYRKQREDFIEKNRRQVIMDKLVHTIFNI
ncbi:glycosyltransferase family 4 protein [Vibrio breoganii]